MMTDHPKMPREEMDAMMHSLAANVDLAINGPVPTDGVRRNGFVLMVFPLETHMGCCNLISNAERDDIITLFKTQVARSEGSFSDHPGHA